MAEMGPGVRMNNFRNMKTERVIADMGPGVSMKL